VCELLTEATAERAAGSGAVSVFVHSAVTRTVLDRLPDLGLVLTRSTGYDHVDLGAAKKRGITVCNVPSYGSRTVAEFTFSLILGLSRR
jgi:D-lactate dehydrogenase